jgi:hypothetical protein
LNASGTLGFQYLRIWSTGIRRTGTIRVDFGVELHDFAPSPQGIDPEVVGDSE